ncbi:RadC family protein [Pontiella agarivorans]|uniref:DNA repair protein RadC n=1 Tax=Pontiella agarivorans TaxID=3038953 RepID=A0ABU5MVC7_9BACT|nr:DNA repair protein RadC [Pontiella agarivorans]MDZ8118179.1 DNA repair protein RadC [Pontiella agarivorans]
MVEKDAYRKGIDDSQGSGHRQRLRERFQTSGHRALADYEFLELLLTYSIPRKDTKPLAKELMKEFGSFSAVLDQSQEKLTSIDGLGSRSASLIRLVRSAMHKYLEEQVENRPTISKPEDIASFVRIHIGSNDRECVMLICLNDANKLLHHEIVNEGSIRRTPFYPRDILKPAILHNATGVIIVHNHPSGEAIPSEADHGMTSKLESLAGELDIRLIDHLITTPKQTLSLKTGRLV